MVITSEKFQKYAVFALLCVFRLINVKINIIKIY